MVGQPASAGDAGGAGFPHPRTSAQEAHRIPQAALTPLLSTHQHSHQAFTSSGGYGGFGSDQVSSGAIQPSRQPAGAGGRGGGRTSHP